MPNPPNPNFWGFLLICFGWLSGKTGRIINCVIGSISILAVSNVITPVLAVKLTLAGSILGYWRSQWVSNTVDNAKAIVAKATVPTPITVVNPVEIK